MILGSLYSRMYSLISRRTKNASLVLLVLLPMLAHNTFGMDETVEASTNGEHIDKTAINVAAMGSDDPAPELETQFHILDGMDGNNAADGLQVLDTERKDSKMPPAQHGSHSTRNSRSVSRGSFGDDGNVITSDFLNNRRQKITQKISREQRAKNYAKRNCAAKAIVATTFGGATVAALIMTLNHDVFGKIIGVENPAVGWAFVGVLGVVTLFALIWMWRGDGMKFAGCSKLTNTVVAIGGAISIGYGSAFLIALNGAFEPALQSDLTETVVQAATEASKDGFQGDMTMGLVCMGIGALCLLILTISACGNIQKDNCCRTGKCHK